jgi:transposase
MAKDTMQSAGDRSHPVALVGSEGSWPMRQVAEGQSARDGAAVFVAMELSKSAWLLAVQGSPSGKTSSHRLEGGDVAGLLALLRRLQAREQQACGGGEAQIVLGYEAGYDGFWLQRRLAAEGIRCWVMDPGSLQVNRKARRAKTEPSASGPVVPIGWMRRCCCGR